MSEQIVFGIRIDGISDVINNQQKLTEAVKQTKKELQDKDIDSPEYKKLEKTLGQLTAAQQQFRNNARTAAKEASASATGTEGAYRKLSAQLMVSRDRLKDLAAAGQTNTNEFKKLTTEVGALDKQLKSIDSNVGQFQRNVGNYQGKVGQFASGIGRQSLGPLAMLMGGPAVAGAATFAMLASGSKTIFNFEQSLADLSAVANVSAEELEILEKSARKLGGTTAFSADQVVALQTELAKLGFNVNDITGMSKAVIDLSVALGADAAQAAALMGGQLRSFGLEAKDATRIANSMAAAATKSALDFGKLEVMLPIVSTVSNQVGDSFEAQAAKLGILSNANLDASTAATGLRNIYLINAREGLTYQEGLDSITNSTDRLKTATDLYGTRSAVVALILSETQEAVKQLEADILNAEGALEEMNRKKLDTVKGQVTLLSSAWTELTLAINTSNGWFGKFIKSSVTGLTELIMAMSQVIKYGKIMGMSFDKDSESIDKTTQTQISRYTKAIQAGKMSVDEFIEKIDKQISGKDSAIPSIADKTTRAYAMRIRDSLVELKQGVLSQVVSASSDGLSEEIKELIARLNEELAKEREKGKGKIKEIEVFVEGSLGFLRNYIKDLNKELEKTKIGTPRFDELTESVKNAEAELKLFEDRLKTLKGAGILGVTDQLEPLNQELKVSATTINQKNKELQKLNKSLGDTTKGSREYYDILKQIDELEKSSTLEANDPVIAQMNRMKELFALNKVNKDKEKEDFEEKKEQEKELALFTIELAWTVADAAFEIQQNNLNRMREMELSELQRTTDARLAQVERGSAEEAAILEEQKNKEAEIEAKARKKQQQLDIQQALINGALGITKTFANLGFPKGLLGAALVAASTAAQVAVIRSQGFAEGGFTGYGGKYEPAGTVHRGEVVWSQRDVSAVGGAAIADRMRPTYSGGYFDGGAVGSFSGGGSILSDKEIQAIAAAVREGSMMGTKQGQKESSNEERRFKRLEQNIAV
jgi:hypothetical protein